MKTTSYRIAGGLIAIVAALRMGGVGDSFLADMKAKLTVGGGVEIAEAIKSGVSSFLPQRGPRALSALYPADENAGSEQVINSPVAVRISRPVETQDNYYRDYSRGNE